MAKKSPPRFEQFFALRRFYPSIAFSPDAKTVYYITNTSGQFNLWRSPARGGTPHQLTAYEDSSVRSIAVTHDGKTLVITADPGGNENHQIFALPAKGGWPQPWTDAPNAQHFVDQGMFSPDGSRLAFAANSRVPQDMDAWVRDLDTGEVRKIFGGDMIAVPISWAPDGKRVLVIDQRSNTDSTLLLVDPETEEGEELTPHEGEVRFTPGPWAADGSGFYVLSDQGREFIGLGFFSLAERAIRWVETPDWDIEEMAGSADGRMLGWIVNEDGWSRLRFKDVVSGAEMPAPKLPAGCSTPFGTGLTFSRDGKFAALLWAQPRRATELYVIEVSTGASRRITDSMLGGIPERALFEPELIRFKSFDGREIPAWLYRPKNKGRVPMLLSIHGGPESQERPVYAGMYQYLLSRGIGVLATNIRGSTGYGKTYQKLIHHDWGGADLKDFEHAVKFLLAQDWVDPKRLGVWGGSYGGFATLSCVTRLPDYWAAAVEAVGPSNLVTFARAVPPHWRRMMAKWVGDPETEGDFLMERSPITYVENVKAPLLVLQGANDPRVVKPESDQMVERLRELGRTVEYEVFEDEGHGFTKRANEIRAYRLAADWLVKYLGKRKG